MDIKELTFRGDDKTRLYACGKCGKCYSPEIYLCKNEAAHAAAKRAAEICCVLNNCEDCGKQLDREFRTCCESCFDIRRVIKAAKITADQAETDCIFTQWPGTGSGGYGEGYYQTIDELKEQLDDESVEMPPFVHPCEETRFSLDASDIIENACSDLHEDAADQLVDVDVFDAAVKAFVEKQSVRSFYPDYGKVIILDQARFDQYINSRKKNESAA